MCRAEVRVSRRRHRPPRRLHLHRRRVVGMTARIVRGDISACRRPGRIVVLTRVARESVFQSKGAEESGGWFRLFVGGVRVDFKLLR